MRQKLIFSTLLAGLLIGCGGGSSSKDANTTTPIPSETPTTTPTSTRSGNSQGAGGASGIGTLTEYSGTFAPIEGEGKKLFAIYMIGSDLERKGSAGTNDFNEMVAGYNALSADQKADFDIIVAFGGANKEGWKGMKIATIDQIITDSQDGIYGNSGDYTYQADEANMGYKDSFQLFLNYVKNNYGNHSTKFLEFWDHGAGAVFIVGGDDYFGGNSKNPLLP